MKNNRQNIFLCFLLGSIITLSCRLPLSALKNLIESGSQETTLDVPSKAPIPIAVEQDTTLGGLEGEPARVQIPAGAFMTDASASISYSDALPALPEEGWVGLGASLSVELESEQTRSDQPMQVRMEFDATGIEEPGEVFVGYFNEQHGWYFFEPDSVDLDQGVLTFTTFHFSLNAPFSADEAKRIDKYLDKKATETFVKENSLGKSQGEVEAMVKTILEQGVGINDNRVVEIIIKGVVEQMPLGNIAVAIYDHDSEELTQATLEETFKALGNYVASDDNLLKEITSDKVKIFANSLSHNAMLVFDLNKFANRVVELSNEVITNVWFNPEIEKAFQVYKNGAEGGWFGYSVDARDWDQLSVQMRGIFAKVQSDYLSSYCSRRGINPDQLSEDERNTIAQNGMEALKAKFDERLSNQEKIDEIKAKQEQLIELFANQQLLIRESVNPMYAGNEDLETLMNRLFLMTEKIMRDTGRSEIIFHSFDENIDRPGTQIYGQQIANLVRTWYINREISPEQAEKAYHQALIDMGLIEDENLIHGVEPQKVTCTGDYVSTFTEVYEDESARVCSFTMPFSIEFWNVGALGGAEYSGASLTWSFVSFKYADCSIGNLEERVSTGEFSGGPNGHATIGWANFSLNSGVTASVSYSDEDEYVSGSCTILNPSAFSGWK